MLIHGIAFAINFTAFTPCARRLSIPRFTRMCSQILSCLRRRMLLNAMHPAAASSAAVGSGTVAFVSLLDVETLSAASDAAVDCTIAFAATASGVGVAFFDPAKDAAMFSAFGGAGNQANFFPPAVGGGRP